MTRLFVTFFLLFYIIGVFAENRIVVSKKELRIYVLSQENDTLWGAPIACGKNYGNKQKQGDMRTPEGTYKIVSIENSSSWKHDFNDGEGIRKGAYGPFFIRLKVPKFSGIGIHGTCFPESMGTRCSEGCVRLKNEDLKILKKYVKIGMICTILKD